MTDATSSSSRSWLDTVREWFWSSSLQARVQHARSLPSPDTKAALRARLHAKLAIELLDNPASFDTGEGSVRVLTEAGLNELRQAAFWTLSAVQRSRLVPVSLDDALDRADEAVIAFATRNIALDRAREALTGFEIAAVHKRSDAELADDVLHARGFVTNLLLELEVREAGSLPVWRRRVQRTLGILFVSLLAVWLTINVPRWMRPDLAESSPWTASTALDGFPIGGLGFTAPPGPAGVFFHTTVQDNPWIEFDLTANKDVHGISVVNRSDCCQERATPLIVEISNDHANWTQVARRDAPFTEWTEWFSTRSARWVRFRSPRNTALHFASVTIK